MSNRIYRLKERLKATEEWIELIKKELESYESN
jgi:hypothetical protein